MAGKYMWGPFGFCRERWGSQDHTVAMSPNPGRRLRCRAANKVMKMCCRVTHPVLGTEGRGESGLAPAIREDNGGMKNGNMGLKGPQC